ncbi:MAG: ribose 5-phosphate isomerase A [Pseudomonadota bacterium]|nr:ribose 5-phosphate isomerase A [Pseudomonadota bacterium]
MFSKTAIQHSCKYLDIKEGSVLGLGTGRTVEALVDVLHEHGKLKLPEKIVVSSIRTERFLLERQVACELVQHASYIDLYIDGVDAINPEWECLKGKGGAMTGEKLCLDMSRKFVAIYDKQKEVAYFNTQSVLPIEVVSWARSSVGRFLVKLGGRPVLREKKSELGNDIIDCYGLSFAKIFSLDRDIACQPGVVSHGLFVKHKPDATIVIEGESAVWTQGPK